MRLKTVGIVLGGLVGVVVVAVGGALVYLSTMDFNAYRGLIADQAKAATGRDLAIKGDLKLAVGLAPSVAVNDVTFANAPWSTQKEMLKVGRFEAQVQLLPLVFGDVKVDRLVLIKPEIVLETDAQGRGNWEFGAAPTAAPQPQAPKPAGGPAKLPTVKEVEIRDAQIVYRDGVKKETTTLALARALLRADSETSPLKLDVEGTYNQMRIQAQGQVGSLASLGQAGAAPFPVDLSGRIGDLAAFKVAGQVREPLAGKGYDIAVNADGAELSKLAELAGLKGAAIGPFKVEAKLNDQGPNGTPSLPSLSVQVGRIELAQIKIDGSVRNLLGQSGVNLAVVAEGREIGAFSGLALPGMAAPLPAVPAFGPFKASVRVADGQGGRPTVPELKLDLGNPTLLKVVVDGSIQDPMAQRGIAINLSVDAPDIVAVAQRAGAEAPTTGPLQFKGRVGDAGPNRYQVSNMQLKLGEGDLAGDATVALGGAKPVVTANLTSNVIDLSRRAGGAPAQGAAPAAVPAAAPAAAGDGKVFPNEPLPFDLLNVADADIKFRGGRIVLPTMPLQEVNVALALKGGELAVKPFALKAQGGSLSGEVGLAGPRQALTAKLDARDFNLGNLLREMKITDLIRDGKLTFAADVRGGGRTVRALMASLTGQTTVTVGPGEFDNRLLDLLGANVVQVINPMSGSTTKTQLNCVVQRFDIQNGVANSRVFTLDTSRWTVLGEGNVNLGSEVPALLMKLSAKEAGVTKLVPPIKVSGTLASPSFAPDMAAIAQGAIGQAAGAAARGAAGGVLGQVAGGVLGGGQQPQQQPASGGGSPCQQAFAAVGMQAPPGSSAGPAPAAQPASTTAPQSPVPGVQLPGGLRVPGLPGQQAPQQQPAQPQRQQTPQQQPEPGVGGQIRNLLGR